MTDEQLKLFDEFFDLLIKLEGGYVNNSHDKGGKTKYGVSKGLYDSVKDKYKITDSIENLTVADAKKIYLGEFFVPIRKVDNKESYYLYFDLCVNSGYGNYVRCKDNTDHNFSQSVYDWRENFYQKIVDKDESQARFLKGWLNRLELIKKYFKGE